jgi:hypothetical protein
MYRIPYAKFPDFCSETMPTVYAVRLSRASYHHSLWLRQTGLYGADPNHSETDTRANPDRFTGNAPRVAHRPPVKPAGKRQLTTNYRW